ncbi:ATP-binding protein [Phascolarctobacterium sp.]|uniref:ATP-binding protein n=1 Tax=Phascolarctobacterium sp. TaxID=2049039 RepID=UPI0025D49BF9|nr:ATP-binding protein [uncultured Phascolarctobacterium sp.]
MRELSLHILDLAQNSIEAGARSLVIEVNESENGFFVFRISDDGRGMSQEMVHTIRDPFVTTRTTRKVGMGIPFMDMVTKQCGGHLRIESCKGEGTVVEATFAEDNIDRPPLGDIASSIKVLLVGTPYLELRFIYKIGASGFELDTKEIRAILGEDADFTRPEVYTWIEDYLKQEILRLRSEQEG